LKAPDGTQKAKLDVGVVQQLANLWAQGGVTDNQYISAHHNNIPWPI